MESHIDRILSGDMGYGHTSLYFPEKKLDLTVYENEDTEGFFQVHSDNEEPLKGYVFPSDPRMVCDRVAADKGRTEVHYYFRGLGLEAGSVIKGDIAFICEGGEFRLPFSVSVVRKYPESSQGVIKNLFHFTNLARNDFREAVSIFYSPEMINVFGPTDVRMMNLYRAFSAYPDSAVNAEGFLIAVHKKSPVIYTTDSENIDLLNEKEIQGLKELIVRKNGWGYIRVNVSAQGDFISLKKEIIVDYDFKGDRAIIPYTINASALHKGRNSGAIILKTFNSEIRIPVNVDLTDLEDMESNRADHLRQRNIYELMMSYISYRLKKMDLASYCDKTGIIADKMTDEDERDILPRLVKTHVLIMEGRDRDASMMLSTIENELMLGSTPYEAEAYFKYLCACVKKDGVYTKAVSDEVASLFELHPDSSFILSLRFYLDEKLGYDPEARLDMLKTQFAYGTRSPLTYLEILTAMTERPEVCIKCGTAGVYALYWGVKNSLFYERLISGLLSLNYSMKGYSPLMLEVLKAYYRKYEEPELLEAVCAMLIRERGNRKRRNDDFIWFEEGVKRGLRITRLYESYLNTMPEDHKELLPEPVLMYFSIGAGVGDDRMAFLYANLIRHKDQHPVREILKTNEQRIAGFAVKEAEKGKVNDNLALIYEYVSLLNIKEINSRLMLALSPLIFKHEITVDDPDVRMVVAVENGFCREHSGNVIDGRAMVDSFGGDYELILEYNDMHRAVAKRGIKDRMILNPNKFVKAIRYGLQREVGQAFYVCGSGRHNIQVNQVNETSVRMMASSQDIDLFLRDECVFALIRYYSDNDRYEDLNRVIETLDISASSVKVRSELARLYVSRGMLKEVYDLIKEYGYEGVDPVILVRLSSRMISEGINTEDPCLLDISFDALQRGKYDEHILQYLSDEYKGTVKELRDIWKSAKSFGIDTVRIEERILSQMLFSRSFTSDRDDILLSCIENGGRDKIISACLDLICHEFFVDEKIVDRRIFLEVKKRLREDGELSDIASLALIKYYSKADKDEETFGLLSPLVSKLMRKGIVFDFFMEYRDLVPETALYQDRIFVEYRSVPDKRVLIHYCIFDGENVDVDYIDENMEEVYYGVYVGNFVLFYGERLQYFITEENCEDRNPTESSSIERDVIGSERSDGRYDMINDMLLSESVNDDFSLESLMRQYLNLSGMVEELF